jgi:hypothetical protein
MRRAGWTGARVIFTATRRECGTSGGRDLQGSRAHAQSTPQRALLGEVGSTITYRVALSLICPASYLMALVRFSRICGDCGRGKVNVR